ncbi:hypothetical protein ACRALDRAFT_206650 [Sodiomyces alcalophilus JCM 7366]|uniref:uncharacterized protein n=1 Tax=Sodiomyces alcalophilus JCM 7366 TaxID=591952 RepID=UPI0039B563C0
MAEVVALHDRVGDGRQVLMRQLDPVGMHLGQEHMLILLRLRVGKCSLEIGEGEKEGNRAVKEGRYGQGVRGSGEGQGSSGLQMYLCTQVLPTLCKQIDVAFGKVRIHTYSYRPCQPHRLGTREARCPTRYPNPPFSTSS